MLLLFEFNNGYEKPLYFTKTVSFIRIVWFCSWFIWHDSDILQINIMCYNLHRCPELFESTVKQLFALARSKDDRLREFVLLFAPSLLYIYLSSISFGDKKVCRNSKLELGTLVNF